MPAETRSGSPRSLPTPAGRAPSRVPKVKGNWTPASSSSQSALEAAVAAVARAESLGPPGSHSPCRLRVHGASRAGQAGAARVSGTRSPGRSAGGQRRSARPYLTSARGEATEGPRGPGRRCPHFGAAPPSPRPHRPPARLQAPPLPSAPAPAPRERDGRGPLARWRGCSDPCWRPRLGGLRGEGRPRTGWLGEEPGSQRRVTPRG